MIESDWDYRADVPASQAPRFFSAKKLGNHITACWQADFLFSLNGVSLTEWRSLLFNSA